jgi:hypothetical protein
LAGLTGVTRKVEKIGDIEPYFDQFKFKLFILRIIICMHTKISPNFEKFVHIFSSMTKLVTLLDHLDLSKFVPRWVKDSLTNYLDRMAQLFAKACSWANSWTIWRKIRVIRVSRLSGDCI